jgi:hypothetical protein
VAGVAVGVDLAIGRVGVAVTVARHAHRLASNAGLIQSDGLAAAAAVLQIGLGVDARRAAAR